VSNEEARGRNAVSPVKMQIITVLKDSGELSMNDLVQRVRQSSQVSAADVKAVVLPMISSESIELTPDLKLRLHERL